MNKKISLGLALSLIAIASAVTFILTSFFSLQSFNKNVVDVNEKSKKYDAIQTLDSYVREHYNGTINETELKNGILKGYVNGIGDEYSRYLSADEYIEEQKADSGESVGLGFTLSADDSGYIRIADILDGSPADEAGIMPDDMIVQVEGADVMETGFDEAVAALEGTEGSSISMTIRHDGIDTAYTFTRSTIDIVSVTSEMLDGYVGYIRIAAFKENTPEQFITQLEKLTTNGAKSIVFDVRDNPGGLTESLQDCLDPLLPEGVVATAEYKDGTSKTIVYSDASELTLPMYVLVNENTASAGELFAASLRDFGKASIIGMTTYGKGVMQETTEFDDGSAVVLTVAEFRTSKSESFNGKGIVPDVMIANESEYYDAQYSKAVELAKEQ